MGSQMSIGSTYGMGKKQRQDGEVNYMQDNVEHELSRNITNIREHPLFMSQENSGWHEFVPKAGDNLRSLEPILANPFKLYSGQVNLNLSLASEIMSQEMYKFLKMEIVREKEKNMALITENKGREMLMSELNEQNAKLMAENMKLEKTLE